MNKDFLARKFLEKQAEFKALKSERFLAKWSAIFRSLLNWGEAEKILKEWEIQRKTYQRKAEGIIAEMQEIGELLEKK